MLSHSPPAKASVLANLGSGPAPLTTSGTPDYLACRICVSHPDVSSAPPHDLCSAPKLCPSFGDKEAIAAAQDYANTHGRADKKILTLNLLDHFYRTSSASQLTQPPASNQPPDQATAIALLAQQMAAIQVQQTTQKPVNPPPPPVSTIPSNPLDQSATIAQLTQQVAALQALQALPAAPTPAIPGLDMATLAFLIKALSPEKTPARRDDDSHPAGKTIALSFPTISPSLISSICNGKADASTIAKLGKDKTTSVPTKNYVFNAADGTYSAVDSSSSSASFPSFNYLLRCWDYFWRILCHLHHHNHGASMPFERYERYSDFIDTLRIWVGEGSPTDFSFPAVRNYAVAVMMKLLADHDYDFPEEPRLFNLHVSGRSVVSHQPHIQKKPAPTVSGVCRNWNAGLDCLSKPCPFRHVCNRPPCQGKDAAHKGNTCKLPAQA
ncbi:hypothetical protein BCR33DRAFT_713597 [Rhizoclosmatium globosum]|uniref:Uncharacterized protein n=1 Tax=Rhizoclosmatium globosum TaxID=329046 RepID=A0A1Y2CT23_9FUNG|nr:hypothetical protein BCR33DRAFT_726014 [Rhizoclosmatium globosum]ORY50004.1 hypothetical protein BCR33DRAFT_713597 [Rhizoclosmatium globosum]|eukprot:ORY26749.1 hypothetical protein BCR33DRAFT_726014 [Rhizoclosmatium globosum]